MQNVNAAVREWDDKIIFLRKMLPGSADRSYGIQVARLAGLPAAVLNRARHLLAQFEAGKPLTQQTMARPARQRQLSLFDDITTQLLHDLRALDVDDLSPREALATLAALQQRVRELP